MFIEFFINISRADFEKKFFEVAIPIAYNAKIGKNGLQNYNFFSLFTSVTPVFFNAHKFILS